MLVFYDLVLSLLLTHCFIVETVNSLFIEHCILCSSYSIIILFIYFLAVLGLHCCAQAFSSCGGRGLLLVAVHGLLTVVASLVAEHGL